MPQFRFGAFDDVARIVLVPDADAEADAEAVVGDLAVVAEGDLADGDGPVFAAGVMEDFLALEEIVGRDFSVLDDSAPLSPWERWWKMRL